MENERALRAIKWNANDWRLVNTGKPHDTFVATVRGTYFLVGIDHDCDDEGG